MGEDFSCNWKKLLNTLEKEPKKEVQAKKKKIVKRPKKVEQNVEKKPEIWFDDVDTELLDLEDRPSTFDKEAPKKRIGERKVFQRTDKTFSNGLRNGWRRIWRQRLHIGKSFHCEPFWKLCV